MKQIGRWIKQFTLPSGILITHIWRANTYITYVVNILLKLIVFKTICVINVLNNTLRIHIRYYSQRFNQHQQYSGGQTAKNYDNEFSSERLLLFWLSVYVNERDLGKMRHRQPFCRGWQTSTWRWKKMTHSIITCFGMGSLIIVPRRNTADRGMTNL